MPSKLLTTERIGVDCVRLFFSRCGWVFREQCVGDFGVDAQVEAMDECGPTGQLIALQIKSGQSYFKEKDTAGFVFRFDERHKLYWLKFSIPVLLVLYDDVNDKMYWQLISDDTIENTGKLYKVTVPAKNVFDKCSLEFLQNLSAQPRNIQKLNRLYLDKYWMLLIDSNEEVYVEFEEWVNKSLPRYQIRIGCSSKPGIPEFEWPLMYIAGSDFLDALRYTIPWADFETDEEAYRDYMKSKWDAECYMGYDKEDNYTYYSQPFEEWYSPPEGIMPIGDDGETESYRLILSLNEIGEAFLELDDFLNDKEIYLDPPTPR